MKAFISVDLEGMPYVVIPGHLNLKGAQYEEVRKIATKITLIVTDQLHKNGFDNIIIADSHGPMVNLLVEDLPECVEIVRGSLRPTSMVAGVAECDAALFLGYHAKAATENSTFDHTYHGGAVHKILVNGVESSEFLLNAYVAGELNVPVILVAGDRQLLEDDVKTHAPWSETVALKQSFSRLSAKSPSLVKIEKELRDAVNRAHSNFSEKTVQPLITKKPVEVKLTLRDTHQADAIALLPCVKRIDAINIEYTASTMIEAYNTFQALMYISSAASGMIQRLR
jgi:D-amino peptidase